MHFKQWFIGAMLIVVLLLAGASALYAQGGEYTLAWFSVDGGGAVSSGEGYTLRGAAGQSDAGQLGTNGYTLTGGVLAVGAPGTPSADDTLFMPTLHR